LSRMSMLLDVLADDAQRSPAAECDDAGRGQKWLCLMCRFTGPVNVGRSRWPEAV
jgi:hypothetical protein